MAFATWNSADKSADITLSGGDLTATKTSAGGIDNVRATQGESTGKWYCEITIGASTNFGIGLATSSCSLEGYTASNMWAYYGSAQKFDGSSAAAYGATYGDGDIISVLWDADTGDVIFWKNGSTQGTAYSSVSGTLFVTFFGTTQDDDVTANFGASAFTYTPPEGYTAWQDGNEVAVDGDVAIEVGVEASHTFQSSSYTGNVAIEVGVESPSEASLSERDMDVGIEVGVSSPVTYSGAVQPSDLPIEVGVEAAHEFVAVQSSDGAGSLEELTATGEAVAATSSAGVGSLARLDADGVNEAYQVSTGAGRFEALESDGWLVSGDSPALEALEASGVALSGSVAFAAVSLRRLRAEGLSAAGGLATGSAVLERLTAAAAAEVGYLISGAGTLRALRAEGAALNGGVAEGSASLEEMVAEGLSIQESIAVGAAVFPYMIAEGVSEATVVAVTGTWVVNTRTGSVTRYLGYPANSFAVYNGRCLAASSDGLYDTSGGDEAFTWTLRTGATDDKRANLKRLTELLLGVRYSGSVAVGVWTDGEVRYSYALPEKRPNALHQVRVVPGKGLRSRYYKVELAGSGRFEMDSMQMTMPDTTRRVG